MQRLIEQELDVGVCVCWTRRIDRIVAVGEAAWRGAGESAWDESVDRTSSNEKCCNHQRVQGPHFFNFPRSLKTNQSATGERAIQGKIPQIGPVALA